ncbi:MAG: hypothetical protein KH142_01530, partial [Slackia piriformis]|nr:hypothetical protein [Slackia piriformis]
MKIASSVGFKRRKPRPPHRKRRLARRMNRVIVTGCSRVSGQRRASAARGASIGTMRERRKTPNSAAPIAVEPPIESGASPMRRPSKKKTARTSKPHVGEKRRRVPGCERSQQQRDSQAARRGGKRRDDAG